jgi:CheY-like chemotaxis protein
MFPSDAKVMIVDDSNFTRSVMINSLKEIGFWKILEAESSMAVQRLLAEEEQKESPVHLLITDIHMPEMTGIELLQWIRKIEAMKSLPVIVVTSSQDKSNVVEAGKLGATSFLVKPFSTQTLRERIAQTWARGGKTYYQAMTKKSAG